MVSFIVPVYQAVKTLDACVAGILSQSNTDLELILVDDGSTDGSGELCDSYTDRRVRVLHGKNTGAAAARNKGIAAAAGEWIAFADSDDVISPAFLSSLIKIAGDTEADIVSCAHVKCDRTEAYDTKAFFEDKAVSHPRISVYKGKDGAKALLYQKGFISAPWGMISRRTLWNDLAFPEGTAAEDMGTIYRLFLGASCVARTDDILYGYVQSASNTVFSTSSKRNPDYYIHSRQMLIHIKKNHPELIKAAASRHLSTCFQILSETDPDTQDAGTERFMEKIYADIRSVRRIVLRDPHARLQNRAAAAMSYISTGAIHKELHKRYLKSLPPVKARRVCMAEYQGRCDEEGRAVGHAPKVLSEYFSLISDDHDISIYVPQTISDEIPQWVRDKSDIYLLPRHIVMKGHAPALERAQNKLRMFGNIRYILKHSDADVIWFFNVEFYLFLYLMLFGNRHKRIVVTLFLDGYHTGSFAGIKQRVFEAGQKRIYKCISTGAAFHFRNMPSVFVPDYICDDATYAPLRLNTKESYVVCLGTMDRGKQLEELVDAFCRISYRLLIAGRFYDKEWYRRLKEKASDNIEIRDEYPTNDEYLSLLSRATYAVLPYNEGRYSFQTSGVMQEAVFTDTIVLTHKDILKGNGIPGVGYVSYDDISDDLLMYGGNDNYDRNRAILSEYDRLRRDEYNRDSIKEKIKNSLSV
ncbi:MAG: glycosyltransferase [Lachnospiraceae bacterium]|nr:glycosyltransferase [Lachnospiraceae bacterium]